MHIQTSHYVINAVMIMYEMLYCYCYYTAMNMPSEC